MVRYGVLAAAFCLLVTTVSMADPPKLSNDHRKLIAKYTEIMEKDYQLLVAMRGGNPPLGLEGPAFKAWIKKRGDLALKFSKKEAMPRSRKRLVAFIGGMSTADLRRRNEVMNKPLTDLSDQERKEVDAWLDRIEKIEDAVLQEIPESKFPKFD